MNLTIVASGDFFSDYGGGQIYVRNIVDELTKHQEIQVTVISLNEKSKISIQDYNGIPVHQVNDENTLHNAIVKAAPDIVHANGAKLLTARICKQLHIPCVVTVHHGGLVCPAGALLNSNDEICSIPADYHHCLKCYLRNTTTGIWWHPLIMHCRQEKMIRFGERLKRLPFVPFLSPIGETGMIVSNKLKDWYELKEITTHFIAPSNAIADALIKNGCPQEKITIITHGIPISVLRLSNLESSHSQFSILNSQLLRFYYVGRINYIKGIHILLRAFAKINNPSIELHIIGGAGNKSELRYMQKLQRRYHQDKRIIWYGKLDFEQMTEKVRGFNCLIHPAICLEVFGLNISEALAEGKYVIATRCGGPEMQIHSEDEGMLVSPNNVEELKKALLKYIDNPKQTKTQIIDIKQHIQELYNLYSTITI